MSSLWSLSSTSEAVGTTNLDLFLMGRKRKKGKIINRNRNIEVKIKNISSILSGATGNWLPYFILLVTFFIQAKQIIEHLETYLPFSPISLFPNITLPINQSTNPQSQINFCPLFRSIYSLYSTTSSCDVIEEPFTHLTLYLGVV